MGVFRMWTLLMASAAAFAQSYQGGIRGAVSDPQNASVRGVTITLIDQSTGVKRTTISNDVGEYVFSSVDPAAYGVAAETPGFKKFERRDVIVGTQEFLTVDIKLEVGQVSESIMVTEEVPLIETSNDSSGQLIDRQKLADLPNSGRSPFMMAMIVPAGNPTFNRMQDQLGSSAVSYRYAGRNENFIPVSANAGPGGSPKG